MRIAMVQGSADPERDGVADYVRHLTAALRDLGEEVLPVPVLGPREAAERLHALQPDLAHVQFAPSAFGFSARPGLLPNSVRGVPFVTTLHEYGWWASPRWVPGAVWRARHHDPLVAGPGDHVPEHDLLPVVTCHASAGTVSAWRVGRGPQAPRTTAARRRGRPHPGTASQRPGIDRAHSGIGRRRGAASLHPRPLGRGGVRGRSRPARAAASAAR